MPRNFPRLLAVVAVLLIIGQAGFTTSGDRTVIVQPGDTLWGFSQRYGVPVNQLAAANGMKTTDILRIGRRMTISPLPRQPGSPGPPPAVGTDGPTRLAWAQAFAARLGATNREAVLFVTAWEADEKARPQANNPLNSTLAEPGSGLLPGNPYGVRLYPTSDVGLAANVATILNAAPVRGYQAIIGALRRGDVGAAARALQASAWCFDPKGPLGHECPGYGSTILAIVAWYRMPGVFTQAGRLPAGTTPLSTRRARR